MIKFTITMPGLLQFIGWVIYWIAFAQGNEKAGWLAFGALVLLFLTQKRQPAK